MSQKLVGGSRVNRKSWKNVFKSCSSKLNPIVYCVNLNSYNQTIFENNSTNQMDESITIFEKVLKEYSYKASKLYLIFGNTRMFTESLGRESLRVCFEDAARLYCNVIEALEFVKQKYLVNSEQFTIPIFTVFTDLDDSFQVKKLLNDIVYNETRGTCFERGKTYFYTTGKFLKTYKFSERSFSQLSDVTIQV